jgi:DNA-binding beta-propeller fold protein YncE
MSERHRSCFRPASLSFFLAAIVAGSLLACATAPRPAASVPEIFWPKPPDPPRVKFLFEFSTLEDLGVKKAWYQKIGRILTGSPPAKIRLVDPYDIFADGNGKFYISDTATRSVHILDRRAGVHREISSADAGRLGSPIGVAVHKDGRLFVSDSLSAAVFVYDTSGALLGSIGKGELSRPTGIALDGPRDRLFVVDTTAHSVKAFDLAGALVLSIGGRGRGAGSFNFPTCVALDREGRIYVGDTLNFRIQVFDRAGHYISHFGEAGDGTGYFSQIKGLDVDSEGHIYVTDGRHDVIQVFNAAGEYLLSIGGPGQGPGEFHMPVGLHVDERDRIYVVDRLNQRIQVLQYIPGRDQ